MSSVQMWGITIMGNHEDECRPKFFIPWQILPIGEEIPCQRCDNTWMLVEPVDLTSALRKTNGSGSEDSSHPSLEQENDRFEVIEAQAEIRRHHRDFQEISDLVQAALEPLEWRYGCRETCEPSERYERALKEIRNIVG